MIGIGPRALRYSLAFPRTSATYVDSLIAALEVARADRVVGVVWTVERLDMAAGGVRALRVEIAPSAPIVIIHHDVGGHIAALQAAGVSLCADRWLAVQSRFGELVRRARPIRRPLPANLPRRLLQ